MDLDQLLLHRQLVGVLVAVPADRAASASFKDHFAKFDNLQLNALTAASSPPGIAFPSESVRFFPKLGLAYGKVTRDGLASLRADQAVGSILSAPEISPIRPIKRIAAAAIQKGPTWGIRALHVPELWAQGLTGKGVLVGHLDTGIDGNHPVFEDAIEAAAVIDYTGIRRDAEDPPTDSGEHGTHTAAIIVGREYNNVQVGVAPSAKLITAEIIEYGDTIARILGGLEWVLTQGARIVNLSLGIRGYDESMLDIIRRVRANECLPIIAVGNEGPDKSRSPGNYSESLSVGAANNDMEVPPFSSSEKMTREDDPFVPDLIAPGAAIFSAVPKGGFEAWDGTSMATPHISGLAALLFEAKPDASIVDIEKAILSSCTLYTSMDHKRANRGFPNAIKALATL